MLFDIIDTIFGLGLALLLTIAVELYVIYLFKKRSNKLIVVSIVVNLFTNVTMNLLLRFVFSTHYILWLIILEIIVFVIEAFAYYTVLKKYKDSFVLSFACNAASLSVGLFFQWLFSRNFIAIGFSTILMGLFAVIGGLFQQQTYGNITDISIYTTTNEEITGIYAFEYQFEEYFNYQQQIDHHKKTFELNSPAPMYPYYAIEAEDGTSYIVRFTVELEEETYAFNTLHIGDTTYAIDDLESVTQSGKIITIDLLMENNVAPSEGYQIYQGIYVDLMTDNEEIEPARMSINDMPASRGFCFFFGDIDQLRIDMNERIL